jgi:putative spermidine/putrescine transport system ATP-binding protein
MSTSIQTMAGVSVRLDGLSKRYGDVTAVDNVNLDIQAGEFITLLGPSGSGKTTTLMMVAGFVTPTEGEITIGDKPVAVLPPHRRGLGMVFQNYALFPHMTVLKNIGFPLEMRRVPRSEIHDRVSQALEMVKLPGYEARYPRQLSGGQQQRIALARAIVFEPPVLLMDEPLGALDKKLREHMQLEIKHIQKRLGLTVIYVTHDQEEALTMSDRIAVMHDGKIEQIGTPNNLYDAPVSAFVADFLGESNLLDGSVVSTDDNGVVEIDDPEGRRFFATMPEHIVPASTVTACLRPERILVVPSTEEVGSSPHTSAWSGNVVEVIYVGDATKYKIAVGEIILTVKRQNDNNAFWPQAGESVSVTWSAGDAKVLER